MRARGFLTLALALVIGTFALLSARSWLARQADGQRLVAQEVERTTMVVARIPLAFGDRLTEENLKQIAWPQNALPAGSFQTVDALLASGAQRVVLRSMEENEPVLAGKVSGPDGRGTLSMTIGEGMRAVAIRVNDVLGVAGFVLPGDRVDVLLTRQLDDRREDVTDVLLQNVKVLGVDQDANDRSEGTRVARAVTLEVTPEQTQKLTLGSQVGTLSLALRNNGSAAIASFKTVTERDLAIGEAIVAGAKPAAPAARRTTPNPGNAVVTVLRGTESSAVRVSREQATTTPTGGPRTAPPAAATSPSATAAPQALLGMR